MGQREVLTVHAFFRPVMYVIGFRGSTGSELLLSSLQFSYSFLSHLRFPSVIGGFL